MNFALSAFGGRLRLAIRSRPVAARKRLFPSVSQVAPALAGALLAALWLPPQSFAQDPKSKLAPGFSVTFSALEGDQATDTTVLPNVWLYTAAGKPPTPFLPAGRFRATWSGFISSDLRDNYMFRAALNGEAKLEINNALVFEA